jgi:hypothetical protein
MSCARQQFGLGRKYSMRTATSSDTRLARAETHWAKPPSKLVLSKNWSRPSAPRSGSGF